MASRPIDDERGAGQKHAGQQRSPSTQLEASHMEILKWNGWMPRLFHHSRQSTNNKKRGTFLTCRAFE
jgi:hypothetical protein